MARDYHSRGSESFGSKICGCIWCLICIGPILTIVGLALLVGSLTDTRSPNIELYNDDVTLWTNQYEGEFKSSQNVQWQYNFPYIGDGSAGIPSTTTDTPLDDTGKSGDKSKISTYQPYLLKTTARVDYSPLCDTRGCTRNSASGQLVITTNSSESLTLTQSPFITETRDTTSACNVGEFAIQGGCVKYWLLSSICVKVNQQNGRWTLDDSTSGNAGCGDQSDWISSSYKRQYYATSSKTVNVDVLVRSSNDPRVKFYKIQGAGSALNFGLSQIEKAVMGIVLLAIGGGITCGLIAMVKFCMKGVSGSSSSTKTVYVPVQGQPVAQTTPVYAPGTYNQNGQMAPQQGYQPQPQYQQPQYQQPVQQPGYYPPQQQQQQQMPYQPQQNNYGGYN